MKRRFLKPGLGLATFGVLCAVGVPAVLAAGDLDTLSPKASTASLAKGTKLTIAVTKDKANVLTGKTLTCTASTGVLTVPSKGFTITITKPTFTGCTDTLKKGDTDKITASGKWSAIYTDASDASGEVHGAKGDKIGIKVPKNGLVVTTSYIGSCAIFFNAKGTDKPATGAYNDATGQLKIAGAPITYAVQNAPHQSASCPVAGDTGSAKLTATYVTSPVVSDS